MKTILEMNREELIEFRLIVIKKINSYIPQRGGGKSGYINSLYQALSMVNNRLSKGSD